MMPSTAQLLVRTGVVGPAGLQRATANERKGSQPAVVIDGFRMVAGVLLAVHYAKQAASVGATLSILHDLPVDPTAARAVAVAGFLRFGVEGPRTLFGLATLVAALVALGIRPRIGAFFLACVGAAKCCALEPAVILDDYVVEVLSFWLMVLPVGHTMSALRARTWRTWSDRHVDGRTATACAAFFFFALTEITLRSQSAPRMATLGLFGAAALAIAPYAVLRRFAVLPIVTAIWSLRHLDGASLVPAASVAACALWMGGAAVSSKGGSKPRGGAAFGVAAAIGCTAVLLIAAQTAAMAMGVPSVVGSTGAVLARAGLPWLWDGSFDVAPGGRLAVILTDGDGSQEEVESLSSNHERARRVSRLLQDSKVDGAEFRRALIRMLVMDRCSANSAPRLWEGSVIVRDDGSDRRVAQFRASSQPHGASPAAFSQGHGASPFAA